MTTTQNERWEGSPGRRTPRHQAGIAARYRQCGDPECRDDHQIIAMHHAFRPTGGLLSLDQVRTLFQRYGGPHADALGASIRARSVIAFEWCDEVWLPMFQFSRKELSVHKSLVSVLRELADVYDGWETASWFALPNSWLADRAPVDMLVRDLSAVWYAARVDRFIALGEATWEKQPLAPQDIDSEIGMSATATPTVRPHASICGMRGGVPGGSLPG